jgi:LEA14-like dessication related protein
MGLKAQWRLDIRVVTMTSSSERERDVARTRWSPTLAVLGLVMFLAGAACTSITSIPTKPDPPTVTLERVRIVNIADGKASISLALRLANPNRFDLLVESVEYEITLDGRQAASGRTARMNALPAQGEATVELAGRVDVAAVATALMALGSQVPVEYAFKGTVTLRDGSVLALSRKGDIPVARFDRLYGSRPQ